MQKILFPYTKDTLCGSLDTEPVSCVCIADPSFMYRAQPCGNLNSIKYFPSLLSSTGLEIINTSTNKHAIKCPSHLAMLAAVMEEGGPEIT